MLTVVMYHYVRDLPNTRYPKIKALRTDQFELQLDHIARTYEVVALADVVQAARGGPSLPQSACLLTFDDGLADHYETVFPRLRARSMPGAFFPPGLAIVERVLLDVHKIHFILAAADDQRAVAASMLDELDRMRERRALLPTARELRAAYEHVDRFDTPEVMLIKGALQFGLPADARSELVDALYAAFVADDEHELARELYLDVAQLRELVHSGMAVGGHGWEHVWLGTLPRSQQALEIRRTVGLLEHIYESTPAGWTMCYPYGSYDQHTLELVREHGGALGLTTQPDVVCDLRRPLEIARLDTNDLPPRGSHAPDGGLAAVALDAGGA
jgi:peptidoglycan/xylan/chitin deacetylase (PgdA/CDA1 family)